MTRGLPDVVTVHPLRGGAHGRVRVPGDKSISHRAFLLGALADGPVTVSGAADSGDVRATIACLRRLGASVEGGPGEAVVRGPLREADDVLDCGNSGTALRLLAGICAGLPAVTVLTGDASLRARPMDRIAIPLRAMGATVDGRAGGRYAPLVLRGGGLRSITYDLPVASAQVKSCVLLAGLSAEGPTRIREPGPSRDHTERMLSWLGVRCELEGDTVRLDPGPLQPRPLQVPADPSSAAFWAVAAAITGGRVVLPEVCVNPTRTGGLDVLESMGVAMELRGGLTRSGEPVADVVVTGAPGGGVMVAGDLVVRSIDELPVLAVAGAFGGGLSVTDAAELRVKESDRIAGVARLLHGLGGTATVSADGFVVPGGQRLSGGAVDSHGDHRIAMAAAVAGLACAGPVTISGFEAVGTSYPGFLADLEALGGRWVAGAGEAAEHAPRRARRPLAAVVTIDGPAGAGKSSLAAALARRLGVPHVDTGAYYRAATLAVLRSGVDVEDGPTCARVVEQAVIEQRDGRTHLDGVDVEAEIRAGPVTAAVSAVSAHPAVRALLVARQRAAVGDGGAVVEGRDAGTVVVPDAILKVWLTASPEARAARRATQLGEHDPAAVRHHAAELARRDARDAGQMVPAADVVELDTTDRAVDELIDDLFARLRQAADTTGVTL